MLSQSVSAETPARAANRLLPCPGVQNLSVVDRGLFVSQGAIEGGCPAGRQRYQRAIPRDRPLLVSAHQGPADAAAAVLAPDEDFLDPGDRPVGVEGQMLEAQQVTKAVVPVHRQEQAGMLCGEQSRIAAVEACPGEDERLRQLAGQISDRRGVTGIGGPDLATGIAHWSMMR